MSESTTIGIVGHRGAMAVEPENTMRSYARAVELGADTIEFDVRLSKDGRLVIMHDALVDRTTDGTGAVADLTWHELQQLDAGHGERIPELVQVWEAFDEVALQIEIKDVEATEAVIDLIRTGRPRSRPTTITSFHPEAVARALLPDRSWRVGLISGAGQADKLGAHLDSGVDQMMINWALIDTPAAQQWRASGRPVSAWPGREPADVHRAIAIGCVDTTVDDPAMGVAARASYRPGSA